jgi:hypothetical protein
MIRLTLGLLSLISIAFASALVPSPVPEPSTYLMMGAGLGALLYVRNRVSKKK